MGRHDQRGAPGPGGARPVMAWGAVAVAVLRRPDLWGVALRQARRLARPGWWHSLPPVPLPDPGYTAFRAVTQYGSASATPTPADVVSYLAWCRQWTAVTR